MKEVPQKRGQKPSSQSRVRISKEVKQAISRFIRRTEKIVRSVSPQAKIVIPKPSCVEKKARKPVETAIKGKNMMQIPIPQFRGTE